MSTKWSASPSSTRSRSSSNPASGLDLQSLDPTKQIKSAIQEGMAEGEKAFNEAKSTFDNPLAEPESAPQIAAEPQPAIADAPSAVAEAPSAVADALSSVADAPSAVAEAAPIAEAPSAVASEPLPEPAPAAETPPLQPKRSQPRPWPPADAHRHPDRSRAQRGVAEGPIVAHRKDPGPSTTPPYGRPRSG